MEYIYSTNFNQIHLTMVEIYVILQTRGEKMEHLADWLSVAMNKMHLAFVVGLLMNYKKEETQAPQILGDNFPSVFITHKSPRRFGSGQMTLKNE